MLVSEVSGEVKCVVERKNGVGWKPTSFSSLQPGDVMRMKDPQDGCLLNDYAGHQEFEVVKPDPEEGIHGICLTPFMQTA